MLKQVINRVIKINDSFLHAENLVLVRIEVSRLRARLLAELRVDAQNDSTNSLLSACCARNDVLRLAVSDVRGRGLGTGAAPRLLRPDLAGDLHRGGGGRCQVAYKKTERATSTRKAWYAVSYAYAVSVSVSQWRVAVGRRCELPQWPSRG